jgi:hypothetical protein
MWSTVQNFRFSELFSRFAGRENVFETPINGFEDTVINDDIAEVSETAAGPIVAEIATQFAKICAAAADDVPRLVEWIHAKEQEYKYYVPALVYLEWLLEETILKSTSIRSYTSGFFGRCLIDGEFFSCECVL